MSVKYTKITPKGIDVNIQLLQQYLYTKLADTWDTTSYDSYGRCYNKDNMPQTYIGNDEYLPMLDVDNISAFSFFIVNDDIDYEGGRYIAETDIIFFCNLNDLSSVTHRADEEVHHDVMNLLEQKLYGYEVTGIVTGYDNVFEGFNQDLIKNDDLQPYHCFRVKGIMKFLYNTKC